MDRMNGDLLFPALSYDVIGACFDAFNDVGPGHKEPIYQRAVATCLDRRRIPYKEQVVCELRCQGELIGSYRLDFEIKKSIILELKVGSCFRRHDYLQVKGYLTKTGLDLGLLVRFGNDGVVFHRVLRPGRSISSLVAHS